MQILRQPWNQAALLLLLLTLPASDLVVRACGVVPMQRPGWGFLALLSLVALVPLVVAARDASTSRTEAALRAFLLAGATWGLALAPLATVIGLNPFLTRLQHDGFASRAAMVQAMGEAIGRTASADIIGLATWAGLAAAAAALASTRREPSGRPGRPWLPALLIITSLGAGGLRLSAMGPMARETSTPALALAPVALALAFAVIGTLWLLIERDKPRQVAPAPWRESASWTQAVIDGTLVLALGLGLLGQSFALGMSTLVVPHLDLLIGQHTEPVAAVGRDAAFQGLQTMTLGHAFSVVALAWLAIVIWAGGRLAAGRLTRGRLVGAG